MTPPIIIPQLAYLAYNLTHHFPYEGEEKKCTISSLKDISLRVSTTPYSCKVMEPKIF